MFGASKTASVSTGGYQISRSLRFNSADSAYLNRTPASAGNRKTFTFSAWVKRANLSTSYGIFSAGQNSGTLIDALEFNSSDQIRFYSYSSGYLFHYETTPVYRDPSAWYHIVVAIDTTQATATDRVKIYVNRTQITAFATQINPTQNSDCYWFNTANTHALGSTWTDTRFLSGYMTEINFVNAQQLTPSSFGETNAQTGVWTPIAYSGSYGTNGFYLNFSDNSNTTAATLGKDYSGNGNNWTPNNFSVSAGVGNDSLVDSPTPYGTDTGAGGTVRGNYCTLNPLFTGGVILATRTQTVSDGNLYAAATSNSEIAGTLGVSSGKWYFETTVTYSPSADGFGIGFYNSTTNQEAIYRNESPSVFRFGGTQTNYGSVFVTGDIVGCAIDIDNTSITFYVNGTSQGVAKSNLPAGVYIPYLYTRASYSDTRCYANFGQRPFAYTAPSGYKALCTQNLPTPTIGATTATQAVKYFSPVLYAGTGATQTISTVGFSPGLMVLKNRSDGTSYVTWQDELRGASVRLFSPLTNGDSTDTNGVSAFTSTGFSLGTNGNENLNGGSFVAWSWKGNGSGTSNTSGSITSTVDANTTSGFSIVTYTGTGANATVGHGLGVAPNTVIVKKRNAAGNWIVWSTGITGTQYLILNSSAAVASGATAVWNSTVPTSSVFSLGTDSDVNQSTSTYVAYCFAEVSGYSKIGTYVGNGSTDGPFVFTGMRPAYVLLKTASDSYAWRVFDAKRNTYNVAQNTLYPNLTNAEVTGADFYIDFLSNGFKLRTLDAGSNGGASTYIFMAFAENPFKYSLAR